jgi:hypothetical protein
VTPVARRTLTKAFCFKKGVRMREYNCVEINKKDIDYDIVKFLIEILNSEVSGAIQYIYVDNNSIVASDGRILGCLKNSLKIENGFYSPLKNVRNKIILIKENSENKYPDYEKVIDIKDSKCIEIDLNYRNTFAIIYKIGKMESLPILNPRYLKLIPPDNYFLFFNNRQVLFVNKADNFKFTLITMEKR